MKTRSLFKILGVRSLYHGCVVLLSIAWVLAALLIFLRERPQLSAMTVATAARDLAAALLALFTILMSVFSIILYGYDKMVSKTGTGALRISEATLHAVSLAGGWPGAALAQQFFRHKCSKIAFQRIFMVDIIGNVLLVSFLAKLFGFSFIPYILWANDSKESSDRYQNSPLQKSGEL